jgi:hypothetical protein
VGEKNYILVYYLLQLEYNTFNISFAASGAIKRSVHEDNQPVDGSIEAVNATLGKTKRIKLDIIYMKNGGRYEGEWKEGMRDGKGKHTWPDGSYYDGEWL